MRLGISTASFYPVVTTENAFVPIKSLGCDVAEVFLNSFCEYEGPYLDAAVKNCAAAGVSVHSIHPLTNQFEPELFNRNPRVKQDALQIYRKVLAAGKRLGAKYYTFHGAPKLKKLPYRHNYEYLAECLNGLMPEARAAGLSIAYETVHWCFFSEPDYFSRLKPLCPDLRGTLDVKQAALSGIPIGEYIDAMAGRIATVHACDLTRDGETALPGRGVLDFADVARRLKRAGFDGPVMLEVYVKDYKDYQNFSELKEALGFLGREFMTRE
ncbi:MAG: sugar phosphate isomerase/epimerase [Clostridiales bacterium]|jgi:sugar phosphate isomerase/epimerase|nr:sugar phosphate isomerase/epimerase [Clostridiales bacterium]